MSWIIYSNRSSKLNRKLCGNGNAPAAQHACRQQKSFHFNDKSLGCAGVSNIGRYLLGVCVVLSLMLIGGAPVSAFPNIGVTIYDAIQKQETIANKPVELDGLSFGILGSVEIKTINHRFQPQWEGLLASIKGETAMYERCSISAQDCSPKIRKWRELISSLKGQPVKAQLVKLNKSINAMVTYANDKEIFGKQDYWATPSEFFKGKGDCEDFAAVKFWSLLELGFSNDQLRMAIVRDTKRKIMHAVVTVEAEGKSYILDSLFDYPIEQKYVLKYSPLYSANLDSAWLHIVTKTIRVSYLNHLESGSHSRAEKAKNAIFVDWT